MAAMATIAPGSPTPRPTPRAMFLSVALLPPLSTLLFKPLPFPVLFCPLPHSLLLPQVVCRLINVAVCDLQDHDEDLGTGSGERGMISLRN